MQNVINLKKCKQLVTCVISTTGQWDEEEVQHAISPLFPTCLKQWGKIENQM